MRVEERIGNHVFCYDNETKHLIIDEFNPEMEFVMDINGIKTLKNMFKFLDDNKLM